MTRLFDQMRSAGVAALAHSRDWLCHPEPPQLAWQLAQKIFRHELGRPIQDASYELQQTVLNNALLVGRWAACGFPTITLGHRTAAAFCGTKMRASDAAEFVRPPWPAFCIRLPTDLLSIEHDGKPYGAEVLLATALWPTEIREKPTTERAVHQPSDQHRWWYKIAASHKDIGVSDPTKGFFSGMSLWGFNLATQNLGERADESWEQWETEPTADSDERSQQLGRALLLSACMYLCGDPRERAQRLSESGVTVRERKSKYREGDLLPQYTEFEVTSSIKVNLHHAVRDYVEHGGSSPTVQTCVAGHWKRVAYGVGRANRRMVHVQPYWRGDLNAPISARVK